MTTLLGQENVRIFGVWGGGHNVCKLIAFWARIQNNQETITMTENDEPLTSTSQTHTSHILSNNDTTMFETDEPLTSTSQTHAVAEHTTSVLSTLHQC